MTVYELTHLFFRSGGEPVYSPKGLGLFASAESAEEAVRYYKTQPGFRDAPDAFSVRRRPVYGEVSGGTVFEALVYLHSADYEFEVSAELGLFSAESDAESAGQFLNWLEKFHEENGVQFTTTISAPVEEATDDIRKFF